MKAYNHVLRAACSMPWALMPQKLAEISAFLELKAAGAGPSDAQLANIKAEAEIRAARMQNVSSASNGSVAVLPLFGTIMKRADIFSEYSGGTSTDKFTQAFRQAVNDPNVRAIIIDVDSGGGSVEGVPELADEIYAARKKKDIVAISDCTMGSAAYYIGCACSEVVVSPSSVTGSIGVYTMHADFSKALDEEGVVITFIQHGANKTEGNSYQPLSPEAQANLQQMVDVFGDMFDKFVAKGRGVSVADVQKKFGQGRVFTAQAAVKAGLADRVGTLDDVLAKYGVSRSPSSGSASAQSIVPISAATQAAAECSCPCDSCVAGDCSGCNCDGCGSADCSAENCNCGDDTAAQVKIANASRTRRLQLVGA